MCVCAYAIPGFAGRKILNIEALHNINYFKYHVEKATKKLGENTQKNKHKNCLIQIPQNGNSLKHLRGKLSSEEKRYRFSNKLGVDLLFPAAEVRVAGLSSLPKEGQVMDTALLLCKFICSATVYTASSVTWQIT